MRKAVIIAILFCQLVLTGVFAQTNYPIYVTPTLTPPYSLNLSDYSKFGSQKLMVNVTVNDLNISNLPVKLRIKMETAGIVIENPPTINASPIYLDGGSTSILYGKDLLDYFNIKNLVFKGYEKEAYNRTGQLPEGFYKISVQVLHAHTNRLISNTGTTSAWIAVGKPPVLKIPENEADLGQFKGMPITFSWLASNVGSPVSANNIQYKLEMWEMRIDGIAPEVVAASMPVFHEHTTYNTLYSLYPATLMMEPGMKYAWRVTASDIAGFVSFEQKGQSEIRTFVYKALCDTVTDFTASHRARNGLFDWEPQSNHTSYNTEIRNPKTGWVSQSQTFENKVEFFDLEYGTTYELRVQAVCNGDPESTSDFSPWKTLTIPEPEPLIDTASCPDCGCDDMIPNVDLENFQLNEDLKPGDTIVNKTGTTRFIIKTVEPQGNGVYKGLFLFWAEVWNLKFICEYWDLQVNKENVIVNMDFESVYDPQFLVDIDATTNYLNNLANSVNTLTLDARIKDTLSVNEKITSIYINGGDSVIAVTVDEKGEIHEVVINNNADDIEKTMIKGKNGEEYVVTKDGQVMGVNEYKQTGGGNARKIKEHKEKQETENLSSTKEVAFKASDKQKFGFDLYNEEKSALDTEYPPLKNGYRPAYKSVASFGTDKVGVSENGDNIIFKDEMGIPALKTGEDLTVRGASGGSEVALYAYQKINDTTEKVVGKLNIFSFDEQAKKVYIVPVNGAKLPQESELKKTLNKVYAQAVTSWEVVPVDNLEDIVFENGKMTHGESSAFSTYNKDQKTIVKAFEDKNGKLEKDACYLFFVEDVQYKGRSIAGYMPLQRQVGFIYDNPGNNIVAHELGHGAFNLYHTFSDKRFLAAEHSTQNLMDYKGGTELWKHQWQLVQSPDKLWFSWAQDEEEGEMEDYLALKIQELAISLGLRLGENAFATVHSFKCKNIGDISESTYDVSSYISSDPELQAQKVFISNNKGKSNIVNIIILFKVGESSVQLEDKSIFGKAIFGMQPPFLGVVIKKGGKIIECSNQISLLNEFTCTDESSLVAKFAGEDYKGLYIARILKAIHECLGDQEIDDPNRKLGDIFYTEYLKDAQSKEEIQQLKQVSDLFNSIADLLFSSNDASTWKEHGDFFKASYDAYKKDKQEKKFEDYLSRLEGLILSYERRKELLSKFEDREKVAVLVNTFSNSEMEFLSMDLRKHSLNVLASKELRGVLRLSEYNQEELVLRLLKYIKKEQIAKLLDELRKGDLLNEIDEGFNDLNTLFDDNYASLLSVIDKHVLYAKGISDDEAKAGKLAELHEQNKFYNLTGKQEGKAYISASKVIKEGEISITISTIAGYDLVYTKEPDGPLVQELKPIIQNETIKLKFDEPVALYHNAYLKGVDASKRGEIELTSALKLHYYLQCNSNENIKTKASVIIDVGSLALGVGVISGGVKGTFRLVLAICDVASSVTSLLATGTEEYLVNKYGAEGHSYVQSMQMISAVLGFVDLGASGAAKLKDLLKDDVVTVGGFLAKHGDELGIDNETKELAEQTKKIVDEFTEYDDEIARLIDNAGHLGRTFDYDISKVSDHIMSALRNKGYSDAEIEEIIKINQLASFGSATEAQIFKVRKIVEECFSLPTPETKMRKVLPIEDVHTYHLGSNNVGSNPKSVGGFIAKVEDLDVDNADCIYRDLRLDYDNTKFASNKGFATIEFETDHMVDAVRPYDSKWKETYDPPQTLTGLTGSNEKIIPEFCLDQRINLDDGAVLRVFNEGGNPDAVYILKNNVWVEVFNSVRRYDISKVSDHIKSGLRSKGYRDTDIEEIIKINHLASSASAKKAQIDKVRKIVEDCFPMPTSETRMRKVLPMEDVEKYHLGKANASNNPKAVGGFVAKVEDMKVENAEQVFKDLRLDYEDTPFSKDLGFATIEYDHIGNVVRPYKSKNATGFKPPQTFTGMTGSYEKVIPEFRLEDWVELQDGAILRIFDKDGNTKFAYRLKSNVWEVIK